jgi:hypothetical protein
LLDAGGGTVDAITYTVDRAYPLRLKTEAVKPGGEILEERFDYVLRETQAPVAVLATSTKPSRTCCERNSRKNITWKLVA